MTDELFFKSKENFLFLRDCITEYWDGLADPKNGQLHFVKDNVIAGRVISKYQTHGKENFLNFFYKDVLQLAGEFYGKDPTGGDIEKFFGYKTGTKKKYVYEPEKMNKYLDKEINETLFRKEYGLPMKKGERLSDAEFFYPKLFIERLREVTYTCLKEYFLCGGHEENGPDDKKEKYFRFVSAACLYEIFVRKFLEGASFEKVLEAGNECELCIDKLRMPGEECGEEVDTLRNKLLKFLRVTAMGVSYYNHIGNLAAFSAIISMVEFNNVNNGETNVAEYIKRYSKQKALICALEEEYPHLFMEEITMNKNARELYLKFMATMEQEQVLRELCSGSKEMQEQALYSIKQYFQMVKAGEYDSGNEDFVEVVNKIAWKCIKVSKE